MRGVQLDVRSDIRRTVAEFQALSDGVKNKAIFRALNRALDKVATETGREIRKEYNVRQRAITRALTKGKASRNHHMARLVVEGVRLGLIEFDARWRPGMKLGASVKIKVKGPRKAVAGAFIAKATRNNWRGGGSMGMRQVYRRVGRARLPIRSLSSISIPQAFANKAVLAALEVYAVETFNKNLEQQLRFLSSLVG